MKNKIILLIYKIQKIIQKFIKDSKMKIQNPQFNFWKIIKFSKIQINVFRIKIQLIKSINKLKSI